MGSGTYRATTRTKIDSGTTYSYDKATKSSGTYKAHESLDPLKNKTLEARDSIASLFRFPSSSQTTSSLKVVAS